MPTTRHRRTGENPGGHPVAEVPSEVPVCRYRLPGSVASEMLSWGFGECGDKRQGPGIEGAQFSGHLGDPGHTELPDQQMFVVDQPVSGKPLNDQ